MCVRKIIRRLERKLQVSEERLIALVSLVGRRVREEGGVSQRRGMTGT